MSKTKVVVVGPVLLVVLLLLVVLVAMHNSGWLMGLVINGIVGVIILVVLNHLFKEIKVPINIWSVLISAVGGILGVILLVLLNLLGVKDW